MRYERYKQTGIDWLGEVPEHWHRSKLKHEINLVTDKARQDEEIRKYVGLENVEPFTGRFKFENGEEPKIEGEALLFEKNDVLFGKLRPYLAKCVIADFSGRCTFELLVMRPKTISNRYLFYLMLSDGFLKAIDSSTYGAKMPRASWGFIGNQLLYLPPVSEQYAIAKYLDCRVEKIDSIINAKQKQLDLLQQQRQAVISEAVTKGLDKNVPMKDSGIEWIGEVPKKWRVIKIKHLTKEIITGTTPTTQREDYFDGNINWLTPADLTEGLKIKESKRKLDIKAILDGQARLFPTDTVVIVGIGATLGKVALITKGSSFNQQLTGLICKKEKILPEFLLYWLFVKSEAIKNMASFTTLPILNNQTLREIAIVLPSISEQQKLIDYISNININTDASIKSLFEQITKLKEYRQSLIYEAVTGKIKIS
ncbi:MAG: restriction endonuclease subunit S [Clostridia bacterium]|nr:restriction endonuclease subunit S [Clostridia bacterium]